MTADPLKYQYTKARKMELANYRLIEALRPLAYFSGDLRDDADREKLLELFSNARKTLKSVVL